jgi:hypothetical protein
MVRVSHIGTSRVVCIPHTPIHVVRYKHEGIGIKTSLSWDLIRLHWANLEREMTLVVSCDQKVDVNLISFIIGCLDTRLLQNFTSNILGLVIIAGANGSAHRWDIQTMSTGFLCRRFLVGSRPSSLNVRDIITAAF